MNEHMDTQSKKQIAWAFLAALFLFAFAAVWYVNIYSRISEPASFRSFAVSSEGTAVAIPDIATFNFSVVTEGGKDISRIQKDNVEKANTAIAFIKSEGVKPQDIKTQTYQLEPRYQYYDCSPTIFREGGKPCPPPEIVGYTVRQTINVKIRDQEKIGTLIAGVVDRGANSVSELTFTLDDPDKPENDARREAITKAKEKAKAIAQASGIHLGRLLSIEEGYGGPVPYYALSRGADFALKESAAPPPTIEPGSQEIKVMVTLRYEIK